MDMIQTLNAQVAMMMFFALVPMLGMLQSTRAQRGKIKVFMPEDDARARRAEADRASGRV